MTAITGSAKRRGFSLIEVTLATALFAMAATVLMGSFVNALLARERSLQRDVQAADIQMVRRQLLLEPNRDDAEDGGETDTLSSGTARWESEVKETNVVDLFRVDLTMEFPDVDTVSGQTPTHREVLYLLRPTWSETADRSDLLQDKKDDLLDQRAFDY